MKILGIILIALGVLAFAYQGLFHVDPLQIAEVSPFGLILPEHQSLWILPIMGIVELIAGLSLLFTPKSWI